MAPSGLAQQRVERGQAEGRMGEAHPSGRVELRYFPAGRGRQQRKAIRVVAYLVDTSVLARLANSADLSYPVAVRAVIELHRRGEVLHVAPQNLIEFRSVATRPVAANGLGLSILEVSSKLSIFESAFPLLEETPSIYPSWKAIVEALGVISKQVHDARLVAVCHVHGLSHLLSFNAAHFARLSTFGPGIVVVEPSSI